MPGLYKDEGVVLKTIKLGEADRIVTIFTRYNGKVRAVAKGVRKTKSRFGGRLEPFTRVQLIIYRGRELDTITGADILAPYKGVRSEYARVAAAAAVAELVEKVMPERERALSVYELLLAALDGVARGADNVVRWRAFIPSCRYAPVVGAGGTSKVSALRWVALCARAAGTRTKEHGASAGIASHCWEHC